MKEKMFNFEWFVVGCSRSSQCRHWCESFCRRCWWRWRGWWPGCQSCWYCWHIQASGKGTSIVIDDNYAIILFCWLYETGFSLICRSNLLLTRNNSLPSWKGTSRSCQPNWSQRSKSCLRRTLRELPSFCFQRSVTFNCMLCFCTPAPFFFKSIRSTICLTIFNLVCCVCIFQFCWWEHARWW